MPKSFVNSPDAAVVESLEGLLLTQPHLRRLDGFPRVSSADRLGRSLPAKGSLSL